VKSSLNDLQSLFKTSCAGRINQSIRLSAKVCAWVVINLMPQLSARCS